MRCFCEFLSRHTSVTFWENSTASVASFPFSRGMRQSEHVSSLLRKVRYRATASIAQAMIAAPTLLFALPFLTFRKFGGAVSGDAALADSCGHAHMLGGPCARSWPIAAQLTNMRDPVSRLARSPKNECHKKCDVLPPGSSDAGQHLHTNS